MGSPAGAGIHVCRSDRRSGRQGGEAGERAIVNCEWRSATMMAKTATFHCSVITPERAVLECESRFVAFPAHDGEMGVLRDRAPLVCKLGSGALRVQTSDTAHVLFVEGGFAQVLNNRVTILTEQARRVE